MSTEREIEKLARDMSTNGGTPVWLETARRAYELGARPLPPEPQWKPGQVVRLRLEDGMPYLAKRVDSNDGWEVFGVDVVITDDEVTDVEPVAVLTVGDADDLLKLVDLGDVPEAFRFFAERGLDL